MLKLLSVVAVIFISATSTLKSRAHGDLDDEARIQTLLQCGWIIATTEGATSDYEEYVIAAAHLSADKGFTLEWLQEQIQRASETAYDFAGEEGAAERCVLTRHSVENLNK